MAKKIHYRKGIILVIAESTYGTDPRSGTPTWGTDEIYVEDVTVTVEQAPIERPGIQPYRQGLKGAAGLKRTTLAFSAEVAPITVSAGTERPTIDALLRASGFAVSTSTGGDPKLVTYTSKSGNHGSATVYALLFNEDWSDALKMVFTGCRFNPIFRWFPSERFMVRFEGQARDCTESDHAAGVDASHTYTLPTPTLGGSATCTLTELGADTAYPSDLDLIGCEINMEMNPVVAPGLRGANGIHQILLRPQSHPTVNLQLYATEHAGWDPATYQANVTTINAILARPSPAVAGNFVRATFNGMIRARPLQDTDGSAAWGLNLGLVYPEASSDGGGLKPSDSHLVIDFGTKS